MNSANQSTLRVFAAKLRGFFGAQPNDGFDDEMQELLTSCKRDAAWLIPRTIVGAIGGWSEPSL